MAGDLDDIDYEWTSGDVLFAVLDNEQVFAFMFDSVWAVIDVTVVMFNNHLINRRWTSRSGHAASQQILTCKFWNKLLI